MTKPTNRTKRHAHAHARNTSPAPAPAPASASAAAPGGRKDLVVGHGEYHRRNLRLLTQATMYGFLTAMFFEAGRALWAGFYLPALICAVPLAIAGFVAALWLVMGPTRLVEKTQTIRAARGSVPAADVRRVVVAPLALGGWYGAFLDLDNGTRDGRCRLMPGATSKDKETALEYAKEVTDRVNEWNAAAGRRRLPKPRLGEYDLATNTLR